MRKVDVVRSILNLDNPERYSGFTDDFQWTDSLGSPPMDKNAWLGMAQTMTAAIPDLSYIIDDVREDGDAVVVTGHFAGTLSKSFDLSALGLGVIPATGEAVRFPSSTILVSLDGDKISSIHDTGTGPDAGRQGFLKALGVKAA